MKNIETTLFAAVLSCLTVASALATEPEANELATKELRFFQVENAQRCAGHYKAMYYMNKQTGLDTSDLNNYYENVVDTFTNFGISSARLIRLDTSVEDLTKEVVKIVDTTAELYSIRMTENLMISGHTIEQDQLMSARHIFCTNFLAQIKRGLKP